MYDGLKWDNIRIPSNGNECWTEAVWNKIAIEKVGIEFCEAKWVQTKEAGCLTTQRYRERLCKIFQVSIKIKMSFPKDQIVILINKDVIF